MSSVFPSRNWDNIRNSFMFGELYASCFHADDSNSFQMCVMSVGSKNTAIVLRQQKWGAKKRNKHQEIKPVTQIHSHSQFDWTHLAHEPCGKHHRYTAMHPQSRFHPWQPPMHRTNLLRIWKAVGTKKKKSLLKQNERLSLLNPMNSSKWATNSHRLGQSGHECRSLPIHKSVVLSFSAQRSKWQLQHLSNG